MGHQALYSFGDGFVTPILTVLAARMRMKICAPPKFLSQLVAFFDTNFNSVDNRSFDIKKPVNIAGGQMIPIGNKW